MRFFANALVVLLVMAVSGCEVAASAVRGDNKVGVTLIEFLDAERRRPLKVRLWYPAQDTALERNITYSSIFKGEAATDTKYEAAGRRPLILLSHGTRGGNGNQSWLAEVLASQGFIVAAVDHYGNTGDNDTPEGALAVWERPLDISFVLTQMLRDAVWGGRIDASRIGAAGHSAGGYAALALAGAQFRHTLMSEYCGTHTGRDCDLAKGVDLQRLDFSRERVRHRDRRIRAVLAMAPAVGAGITMQSLGTITTPVMIVAAQDDEWLPLDVNAKKYADGIAVSQLVVLPVGGHFIFMSECSWLGKVISTFIRDDICGVKSAADRLEIHRRVAGAALEFFENALAPSRTQQ